MDFTHKILQEHKLEIAPLSVKYISKVSRLVDRTFKHHKTKRHKPSDRIKASLKSKTWKKDEKEYTNLKYYILKSVNSEEVAGLIGFYRHKNDNPFKIWIDWLVVDQKHRGKKLGSVLIEFAQFYGKLHGYTLLSLYTTNHPNESKAQELYAKKGFMVKSVSPSIFWTGFVKEKIVA